MSELQKEILSMIIILDNDSLLSVKPLLEQLLDSEILKLDSSANISQMDVYDKISVLKATRILNDNTPTISYEDALKELEVNE